jgi:hypothetical protein
MQFEKISLYFAYLHLDLLSNCVDRDLYVFVVGVGEVAESLAEIGDLRLLSRYNTRMVLVFLNQLFLQEVNLLLIILFS